MEELCKTDASDRKRLAAGEKTLVTSALWDRGGVFFFRLMLVKRTVFCSVFFRLLMINKRTDDDVRN